MFPHFAEIAVVTNVIPDPILIYVTPFHRAVGDLRHSLESLENGTGVLFAAAEVVNFRDTGRLVELEHEARHIFGMNVVAHLLAFVAVHTIFAAFQVAFDEKTQKSMQLYAGVVWPGEASAAQAAGGHVEITSVFLDHDVRRNLRRAEDGMLALID